MSEQNPTHGQWSSRVAFVLAASGSAIGLGNIWKFPYLLGENGGGAFVLVYLACVFLIGLPLMMAETMLGRRGRKSPIRAMATLATSVKASPHWQLVGWIGMVAGFLILSYYSVIAGWSMAYVFKMGGGFLEDIDPTKTQAIFAELKDAAEIQLVWHTLFMAATAWIVAQSVSEGIEKVTRLMMPALLIMLIMLDAFAINSDGFGQGMSFLFTPDFSKVGAESLLIAMGQAFFSLGLGMGSIMVYGAYLPNHVAIGRSTLMVSLADTLVALMAGAAIFPVVFANHLPPSAGPGLIFETLPLAFSHMPMGTLFGTLFFLLIFFAAITSAIALIEPAVAWLSENQGFSRKLASGYACGACWLLGLATIYSFSQQTDKGPDGKGFFEMLDFLTADIMLPIGGILIAVFAGWFLPKSISEKELDLGKQFPIWLFLTRFVAPLSVLIIFLKGLGIL